MKTIGNIIIVVTVISVMVALLKTAINPSVDYIDLATRDISIIDELRLLEERLNRSLTTLQEKILPTNSRTSNKISLYLPTIYIITPTFKRYEQIPELTRLGQTLMNIKNIHWIVADDTNITNEVVVDRLETLGIPFTYLLTPMPKKYHDPKIKAKPKGVANRNGGMDWIRKHATEGVFYLADDDNTYDIRLFEEIRYTKKVSMFPVGLTTRYGLSTPILKDGKLFGWYDGWISNRKFPVDMAGFAVSVHFLLSRPNAKMPFLAGYEETGLLVSLNIATNELEFLADNCTKIYVWHTKTLRNTHSSFDILKGKYNGTNLRELQKSMMIKKKL